MARKSHAPERRSSEEMEDLRSLMRQAGSIAGITPDVAGETRSGRRRLSTAQLRAKKKARSDVGESIMTLASDSHGVLRWHPGSVGVVKHPDARRRSRRGTPDSSEIIEQYMFETVGFSDVYRYLDQVDGKLTPAQGLWKWEQGQLIKLPAHHGKWKKVLLLIHGTFSNCQNFAGALEQVLPNSNQSFLDWARSGYDAILCYNHPTLSRSPLINALQLESLLPAVETIDIVCHSRGGLVARWWYEVACRTQQRRGKVIFVGSPLAGTSLAAPDRLRAGIDYLTNVGSILEKGIGFASTLIPFLSVAQVLMSLVCSATSIIAKTPVADAVIALVPGLDSQSRVQNNYEIVELRNRGAPINEYFAVASSFRPTDPGWAFWKYFTQARSRIKAAAADLIFPGPHDLVVDRASMQELGGPEKSRAIIAKSHMLDFGVNDRVHHTNYFDHQETVEFLVKTLK